MGRGADKIRGDLMGNLVRQADQPPIPDVLRGLASFG